MPNYRESRVQRGYRTSEEKNKTLKLNIKKLEFGYSVVSWEREGAGGGGGGLELLTPRLWRLFPWWTGWRITVKCLLDVVRKRTPQTFANCLWNFFRKWLHIVVVEERLSGERLHSDQGQGDQDRRIDSWIRWKHTHTSILWESGRKGRELDWAYIRNDPDKKSTCFIVDEKGPHGLKSAVSEKLGITVCVVEWEADYKLQLWLLEVVFNPAFL